MDMAGLAFFDECTERVEEENGNKIKAHFLRSTHTYCVIVLHGSFNFQ